MIKEFNDTGSCYPDRHFMVNIESKVAEIVKLIDREKYFTINRPRQYGKSTILASIGRQLPGEKILRYIYYF